MPPPDPPSGVGDWNVAAETVSSGKVAEASGCLFLQQLSVSLWGGGRAGGGAWGGPQVMACVITTIKFTSLGNWSPPPSHDALLPRATSVGSA